MVNICLTESKRRETVGWPSFFFIIFESSAFACVVGIDAFKVTTSRPNQKFYIVIGFGKVIDP